MGITLFSKFVARKMLTMSVQPMIAAKNECRIIGDFRLPSQLFLRGRTDFPPVNPVSGNFHDPSHSFRLRIEIFVPHEPPHELGYLTFTNVKDDDAVVGMAKLAAVEA